jgi:shikimate dehydrogenase
VKRLAVLGQPIAHSRSPAIHNAAFAAIGMADQWSYEAIEVSPEDFGERVRELAADGFAGANVTIPHKRAALELADEASQEAGMIGAANTLTFDGTRTRADNTDGAGLLASLPRSPVGTRALVLGAGGAARAVVWALTRSGSRVEIWNRTAKRGAALADEFHVAAVRPVKGLLPSADFDIVVNATSVGLRAPRKRGAHLKALRLAPRAFVENQVVVDLVYGPRQTALVRAAKARGATVVEGHEVLVRQAALSFRIWTGIDPPLDVMRKAARG